MLAVAKTATRNKCAQSFKKRFLIQQMKYNELV